MTLMYALYFVLALATLGGLCAMLLKVGEMLGTCPVPGTAARSVAITITTGFAAIGLGGVCLLASLLVVIPENALALLFAALGLAAMTLGIGFAAAAGRLRSAIAEIQLAMQAGPAPLGRTPETAGEGA